MNTNDNTPKIYVACTALYRRGISYGVWIDATQDVEDIETEIQERLDSSLVSDAKKWAIHKYESFYNAEAYLSKPPSLDEVVKLARFIDEYGDSGSKLIVHYGNIDEAIWIFDENYAGYYDSLGEFAEYITRQCRQLSKSEEEFTETDWQKVGESWKEGGDIVFFETKDGDLDIFWNT